MSVKTELPDEIPDGELHQCSKCEFSTQWKSHYNLHVKTHEGERPFKCNQCSYSAARRGTLLRHLAVHSDAKPFKCSKCSFAAKRRNDVVRHERIHSVSKKLHCDFENCNYSTNRMGNLRVHKASHYKEVAPICGGVDDISYMVVTELPSGDTSTKLVFVCRFCGFSTNLKRALSKHENSHLVSRSCPDCDYVTQNKASLISHLRTHEVKYKCQECSYTTNFSGQFRTHKLTHLGPTRQYRCSKCSYVSYWKYEVKKHQKKHPLETETFNKYTRLFEKYKRVIKPCLVKTPRLTFPDSMLKELDDLTFRVMPGFSTNFIVIQKNTQMELIDERCMIFKDELD